MLRFLVGSEPAPVKGGYGVGGTGRRHDEEKLAQQRRFDPSGFRQLVWDETGRVVAVLRWR